MLISPTDLGLEAAGRTLQRYKRTPCIWISPPHVQPYGAVHVVQSLCVPINRSYPTGLHRRSRELDKDENDADDKVSWKGRRASKTSKNMQSFGQIYTNETAMGPSFVRLDVCKSLARQEHFHKNVIRSYRPGEGRSRTIHPLSAEGSRDWNPGLIASVSVHREEI